MIEKLAPFLEIFQDPLLDHLISLLQDLHSVNLAFDATIETYKEFLIKLDVQIYQS